MTKPLNDAIIVSHPSEKSFTLAIAQCYSECYSEAVRDQGHEVILRDHYRLGFNPELGENELHAVEQLRDWRFEDWFQKNSIRDGFVNECRE